MQIIKHLMNLYQMKRRINRIKSAAEDAALVEAMGAVTEEEDNVESLSDLDLSDEDIQKFQKGY